MDSKKHFTKRLLSVLCLASACTLFCLLAGCEEELVNASDKTIEHSHDTEAGLDGIAEAARQARATLDEKFKIDSPAMVSEEPYLVPEEEVAMAVKDISKDKPIVETVMSTLEPIAVTAFETVIITPVNAVEDLIAGNPEEDTADAEEISFKADEKEAIAAIAPDIGLKIPTPAENAELLKETKIAVPSLDNMHIASAPLVSENGQPESEEVEAIAENFAETTDTQPITTAETVDPIEDESKGFFKKIGSTVGNAVGKFTARHYFILGGAVVFVAALIYLRNKKMLSFTPRRKTK